MSIKESLKALYLDYFNNYLTIELFAEHNGLNYYEAFELLRIGKKYHELAVKVTWQQSLFILYSASNVL